jgi:hypothetical protein
MPTGPVFNWLAVAHSALEVLDHALRYRATQVVRIRGTPSRVQQHLFNGHDSKREANNADELAFPSPPNKTSPPSSTYTQQSTLHHTKESWPRQPVVAIPESSPLPETVPEQHTTGTSLTPTFAPLEPNTKNVESATFSLNTEGRPAADPLILEVDIKAYEQDVTSSQHLPSSPGTPSLEVLLNDLSEVLFYSLSLFCRCSPLHPSKCGTFSPRKYPLLALGGSFITEVSITLSWFLSIELTFYASGLAASLGYGAASEFLRRSVTSPESSESSSSLMMTEANLTRLVSKLTQMRGAALKVGQFLSIQGLIVYS